jgi:hypothetical protein
MGVNRPKQGLLFYVHSFVHLGNIYSYVRLTLQLDAHGFIRIFYSSIFLLYMFRVLFAPILRSTAIGMCKIYGMLIHWSRCWLGHPHTLSTVKFGLRPMD